MDRLLRELRAAKPRKKPSLDFVIDQDPTYVETEASDSDEILSITDTDTASVNEDDDEDWLLRLSGPVAVAHNLEPQQLVDMVNSAMQNTSSEAQLQSQLVDILGFDHLDYISEVLTRRNQPLSSAQRRRQQDSNRRAGSERAANLQWIPQRKGRYPHVYTSDTGEGGRRVLPEGTTREQGIYGEEIVVPASRKRPIVDSPLVAVEDLDENCKVTFSGYTHLNRVQSLVYGVVYGSAENMLVCAPTGAGKTDVALLSMLRCLRDWGVDPSTSKIVYVAPLKALAAEITEKMGSRLAWMGVRVRELTGDMQLTRAEIAETQVLVTTPEKWDVVTRKPNDDTGLAAQVKLLIIDEVHLLHEDRGAVIESLVARTLRQVEAQQRPIRIIGLSATLPNFLDVAAFLGVNPERGLFYFDSSFRPVPLEQIFVGVRKPAPPQKGPPPLDAAVYAQVKRQLQTGKSVMVFVHSRKDTVNAAHALIKQRRELGDDPALFEPSSPDARSQFERDIARHSTSKALAELFPEGFAVHHAGMPRHERNLVEKMFSQGAVRILCCTATLAWGVNLPAACVVIRGTQVYDAARGGYVDLGIADVLQIFGRAGRPQYEQTGTGILVTTSDKLDHYLAAITNQYPIESRLQKRLIDNLGAEIALGNVSNVVEAVSWLGYTYLQVRMLRAPQAYGLKPADLTDDPQLINHRRKLVLEAVRRLAELQMVVFDENDIGETLVSKDLGRIASEFYLEHTSVEVFSRIVGPHANASQFLLALARSSEFDGIRIRAEEQEELDSLLDRVPYPGKISKVSSAEDKTATLLQAWISQLGVREGSLGQDIAYIAQNSARIVRAFFLVCLSRRWFRASQASLELDTALARRQWPQVHPLLQFDLDPQIQRKIAAKNPAIVDLKLMSSRDLGQLISNQGWGSKLQRVVQRFPLVIIREATVKPVTASVVRISLSLQADFKWDHQLHGNVLPFWVWVIDDADVILHSERLLLGSKNVGLSHQFDFAVPVVPDKTSQLLVRVQSDGWLGTTQIAALPFADLVTPESYPIRTPLLRLRPLPISALHNSKAQQLYAKLGGFFNPMQTMAFHSLYHTQQSVLLGSPTGSGKTVACELAVWAALRDFPGSKVVYIAPMKALVKERVTDWRRGLCRAASLKLVELTGDTNPGAAALHGADLVVTTPEKFDGVSRAWQSRSFVRNVSLVIMDEVHLLASDRGAILEMIVSRMNHMSSQLNHSVRLLGMSTAVANAGDLASWLGVNSNTGLFNFPPSVRPVPLQMFIDGFADLPFCPFMKSMNKPVFQAIQRHAPNKPVLVFVPSRRQTRLTAQDLISFAGQQTNPRQWLHMTESELMSAVDEASDSALKLSLQFGIAVHHAGLIDSDRQLAHRLFLKGKVQVLVATSTLAWGVNLPAYLVVIKGTQFFDGKLQKYRDMDLTDVLQMMGRAGRPAFDTQGIACVFTKQSTKAFYKYFLNIGFPVESSLHTVLADHIGAELANGSVKSRQQILEFLARTFLFRRVHANPSFYGIATSDSDIVNAWLVGRVDQALGELQASSCLGSSEESLELAPSPYLRIASFYYVSHRTIRTFLAKLKDVNSNTDIVLLGLECLALAAEYDELAIRHNEDLVNSELSEMVSYSGEILALPMVDPHVKALLLVQARMHRVGLPIEDYVQDTVTVLDQSVRILQALIDTASQLGLLDVVTGTIKLLRCIKQAVLPNENMLKVLPGMHMVSSVVLNRFDINSLQETDVNKLHIPRPEQAELKEVIKALPKIEAHGSKAHIKCRRRPVWCPAFVKPQVESWFIIWVSGSRVTKLERVQKETIIEAKEDEAVLIMNDTLAIDYEIKCQ